MCFFFGFYCLFVFCFFYILLYLISFWFSGCWFSAAAALVLPVIRSSPWFTETVSCRSACAFTECEFRSVGLSRLCRDSPRFRCVRFGSASLGSARGSACATFSLRWREKERESGRERAEVFGGGERRVATPRHAMPCHATPLGHWDRPRITSTAKEQGERRGRERAGGERRAPECCSCVRRTRARTSCTTSSSSSNNKMGMKEEKTLHTSRRKGISSILCLQRQRQLSPDFATLPLSPATIACLPVFASVSLPPAGARAPSAPLAGACLPLPPPLTIHSCARECAFMSRRALGKHLITSN